MIDCVEGMRKFTTEIFDTGIALAAYAGMLLYYDWRLALLSMLFPPVSYLLCRKNEGHCTADRCGIQGTVRCVEFGNLRQGKKMPLLTGCLAVNSSVKQAYGGKFNGIRKSRSQRKYLEYDDAAAL